MPKPLMIDDAALARIWDALPEARVVGGAVRDSLLGRTVADIDLATPLPPETVMARLKAAGIKVVPTGLAHGTVTAVVDGRPFEITTLRRDVATDGRHATVAFTADWRADAARRDFTINAMSMARDGSIHDYFGGREDLAAGRVRFVGEAATRIAEDYLRILRFFRFFARYARGAPDAEAVAAIRAGRGGLAILSAERVWSEIKRILAAEAPQRAVALMDETGVLAAVLPEGADPARLERAIARGMEEDPVMRFAALSTGDVEAVAARLRLSEAERIRLAAIAAAPMLAADADDDAVRGALADHSREALIARSFLADDEVDRSALRARIEAMERPVFPLRGRDALALGAKAGPEVGAALASVRAWWLALGCRPDAEACRARLAESLGRN